MPTKQAQTFYRWVDAQGRLHVVSSLSDVPQAERARAESLSLNGVESRPGHYQAPSSAEPAAWQPEWLSFTLGFGAALLLALVFRVLPSGWRWGARLVVVLGAGVLLIGAYLGVVRRTAGIGDGSVLAAPSALLQDARGAVERMNERQKAQEEELKKIQAEGR